MFRPLGPLLALGIAATACGGNVEVLPDSKSGDDFDRAGAQELFLDKLVDDYVDFEGGDSTDWKFFKVKSKGILELVVYWDEYRDIDSVVDVRDRFGALIDSRRHSDELEKDKLDLKVDAGTHFVTLRATRGASVYTIEATFQPFDYDAPDVEPTPIDSSMMDQPLTAEPIPMTPGKPRGGGRPTGSRPTGRVPAPAEEATTSGRSIDASILRAIDGKGGGTVLTLSVGANEGVATGTTGHILGDGDAPLPGGKFRVVSVAKKTAQAQTTLAAGQIAHRRKVRLFLQ